MQKLFASRILPPIQLGHRIKSLKPAK